MKELQRLSRTRTKLANQRTYLAYMRTGFAIAALAGVFKKMYILGFGVFMIVVSTSQYYHVLRDVDEDLEPGLPYGILPLLYSLLSILVLYLQFRHSKRVESE